MKTKHFILAGAAVGVLVLALNSLTQIEGQSRRIEGWFGSYEMPRPKTFFNLFDLSDRAVSWLSDRKEETGKATPLPATANVDKKVNDTKSAEAKKKKTAATKAAQKSPQLEVDVTDTDLKMNLESEVIATSGTSWVATAEEQPNKKRTEDPKKEENKDPKKEENKQNLTQEEWKKLLTEQPTIENAQNLMRALDEKQVTEEEYYSISGYVLDQPTPEVQSVGTFLLRSLPSETAFVMLVDRYQKLETNQKTKFFQEQLSVYSDGALFPVLAQVLSKGNTVYSQTAQHLVGKALDRSMSSQSSARPARGEASLTVSETLDFQIFIPVLDALLESGDPSVSSWAQALLTRIQALKSAA